MAKNVPDLITTRFIVNNVSFYMTKNEMGDNLKAKILKRLTCCSG